MIDYDLIAAADRYMRAVRSLGQQSGYNKLTYFESPILKMPTPEMQAEAHDRWVELNEAGKALTAACEVHRSAARTVEPMAVRDMIAAIIEPDALAEYNAEFAKKPGGPTYTMMANYPQVKAARDKADAILAVLADPRNDGGGSGR